MQAFLLKNCENPSYPLAVFRSWFIQERYFLHSGITRILYFRTGTDYLLSVGITQYSETTSTANRLQPTSFKRNSR